MATKKRKEEDPTRDRDLDESGELGEPVAEGGGEGAGDDRPTTADALRGFASTTSEVVQKAASILEEEIAAGILAAKQVEDRFLNVQELREKDADQISARFRNDAHEVVDIVIDLLEAGLKSIGGVARRVISIRPGGRRSGRSAPGNIPTLFAAEPASPGGAAELKMLLENESRDQSEEFSFQASDLISATTGERIEAACVSFQPSPVMLEPGGTAEVSILVHVPAGTSPGLYSGLFQAARMEQLRAVLSIEVSE